MFESIVGVVKEYSGLDLTYELKVMFAVDALFLNVDRHMNNISILQNSNNRYRFTPIFDNGLSLLSYLPDFPETTPTRVNMSKSKPVLLKTDFKYHSRMYNYEPFIYKDLLVEFINEYREDLGRIADVLSLQIHNKELQNLFI